MKNFEVAEYNNVEKDKYYDRAKFILIRNLTVALVIPLILNSIFYYFTNFENPFYLMVLSGIGLVSFFYLKFTKNHKPIYWIYAIVGTIFIHVSINTDYQHTHYVDFIWILAYVTLAFIGLGRIIGIIVMIINLILVAFFFSFSLFKYFDLIVIRTKIELIFEYLELVFALFIILYCTYSHVLIQKHSEERLKIAIKKLEKKNEIISGKNDENIVLMKEVHHRVKNNLQIIISLLRLQKGNLPIEIQKKFDEAINRIMTMALIHRKLYQSNNFNEVEIESYIKDLIDEIFTSLSVNENVKTHVQSEYYAIGLKTIVPLGLLLNELLSNSFKHAFQDTAKNEIKIYLKTLDETMFELSYQDSGKWVENKHEKNNFGLELIGILTEQMDGSFVRKGSKFTFLIKNLDI